MLGQNHTYCNSRGICGDVKGFLEVSKGECKELDHHCLEGIEGNGGILILGKGGIFEEVR